MGNASTSIWNSLAIGASSCTINAPIIDNVRFLAPFVDDIELIVYEYASTDNYPNAAELAEMASLAERFNFGYTVHLPSSLFAHPLDKTWQKRALREWRRAVETLACLNPRAYIWHWESEQIAWQPAMNVEAWLDFTEQTVEKFLNSCLLPPELLCVENLSYDYGLIWPLVQQLGLSVCLDVGHAWKNYGDLFPFMTELWPKVSAIHLHGVKDNTGTDHVALQPENRPLLHKFIKKLVDFCTKGYKESRRLPLTFEVFSAPDWQACWQEFTGNQQLLDGHSHPKLAKFAGFTVA